MLIPNDLPRTAAGARLPCILQSVIATKQCSNIGEFLHISAE